MALSASRLTVPITAALVAAGATPAGAATLAGAIAAAVIAEITANAVVLPTLLLSAAPGAPVTGTGTVL